MSRDMKVFLSGATALSSQLPTTDLKTLCGAHDCSSLAV